MDIRLLEMDAQEEPLTEKKELVNPTRVITSTVRVEAKDCKKEFQSKTASDIPKG